MAGLEIGECGSNEKAFRSDAQVKIAHDLDVISGDPGDRELAYVDLVSTDQLEQEINRPLKTVEADEVLPQTDR